MKEGGALGRGEEVSSPLARLLVIYSLFRSTCDAAKTFTQLRTMIAQHTVLIVSLDSVTGRCVCGCAVY